MDSTALYLALVAVAEDHGEVSEETRAVLLQAAELVARDTPADRARAPVTCAVCRGEEDAACWCVAHPCEHHPH